MIESIIALLKGEFVPRPDSIAAMFLLTNSNGTATQTPAITNPGIGGQTGHLQQTPGSNITITVTGGGGSATTTPTTVQPASGISGSAYTPGAPVSVPTSTVTPPPATLNTNYTPGAPNIVSRIASQNTGMNSQGPYFVYQSNEGT